MANNNVLPQQPVSGSLPTAMQNILSIPSPAVPGAQSMGNPSLYGLSGQNLAPIYGYAAGGLVTPTGPAPMAMQGGMAPPAMGATSGGVQPQQQRIVPPAQIEAEISRFMQQNPQQVQQIQAMFMQLIQEGELQPAMLEQIEQLALAALQNPQVYPSIRAYAIQQGLIDETDISPQYDQGTLFVLLLAARATLAMFRGQGTETVAPQRGANFANGGLVTRGTHAAAGGKVSGPGTGTSDSIPIRVSDGEYVIPAHVVRAKGTEFFDKMIQAYNTDTDKK